MSNREPIFLILPGVSANAEKLDACRELAAKYWPEARVEIPGYLRRWRGVRGVGRWLDTWVQQALPEDARLYVLAFILGGAALPYAPALIARTERLVMVRSRYQEGVPPALRRRFPGPLTTLLFGRAVADLGERGIDAAGFLPACPTATLIETRPTELALRLGVLPASDDELRVGGGTEVKVNHDFAYHSLTLMSAAVAWLRQQSTQQDVELR